MRTEVALLRLLKKLQSLEASRDRLAIAESLVVATLEMLDARFALLHVFRATPGGYLTAPVAWSVCGGQSATTNFDHFDVEETHLTASPLLEQVAHAESGLIVQENENEPGFVLGFAVGPIGCPVAIVEVHCAERPSEDLCDCVRELLHIYAEHIGLLDYAELDTLTRLNNRKTFDDNFDRFLELASLSTPESNGDEHGQQCWLAVLDIDRFKRINDTFGHLFGDEVLIRVADLMRGTFRPNDKLFRFGGEEFVVLLRFVSAANALRVLERFREAIETHEFPQVGQVTGSIGFARIDPSLTAAEILGRADEALYYCKQNGRNQVRSYERLIEEGLIEPPAPVAAVTQDIQADIDALFD